MDKEFEDWLMKYNLSEFNPINSDDLQAAWNASKQCWLDKNISQRECYQRGHKAGFNKGIDKAVEAIRENIDSDLNSLYDNAYHQGCSHAIEAIKEIKK